MELQGRIIAVLPMKSGRTAKGEWKVQQYVLETDDKYPKRLLFDLFGENKIREFDIQQGDFVTVSFDPDAHQKDGRWFGSNRAWDVRKG